MSPTTPRTAPMTTGADWTRPRPIDESYWVLPGRLLVGAYPGSRSRAHAMERLRRFLEAGVTCFVDLTEAAEVAGYEQLLPFENPGGRRIEYLREPIVDHGVPGTRETMARVLAMVDGALEPGHVVYLPCRAGIGRSAMAAGCWLAQRSGDGERALRELQELWQPAAQSREYPSVPETAPQVDFVRSWRVGAVTTRDAPVRATSDALALPQRLRGAWLGLALGDALGYAHAQRNKSSVELPWTQHTALALCLAESTLATGRSDARDQIERYVRWLKQGECAAVPGPQDVFATADVVKALAAYQWRGLPMAGPHDPGDLSATSLPRTLGIVALCWTDAGVAATRAADCARTTHQSPTILDACRRYGVMIAFALQGRPEAAWLERLPELRDSPNDNARRRNVQATTTPGATSTGIVTQGNKRSVDVVQVLDAARRIALEAHDIDDALAAACRTGRKQAALYGALVGTLAGLRFGAASIPEARLASLATRRTIVMDVATRCLAAGGRVPGVFA